MILATLAGLVITTTDMLNDLILFGLGESESRALGMSTCFGSTVITQILEVVAIADEEDHRGGSEPVRRTRLSTLCLRILQSAQVRNQHPYESRSPRWTCMAQPTQPLAYQRSRTLAVLDPRIALR